VAHICNPSYSRGRDRRVASFMSPWAKIARTYLKNKILKKRVEVMAQMIEHLPNA
jgi:hypothetical protein